MIDEARDGARRSWYVRLALTLGLIELRQPPTPSWVWPRGPRFAGDAPVRQTAPRTVRSRLLRGVDAGCTAIGWIAGLARWLLTMLAIVTLMLLLPRIGSVVELLNLLVSLDTDSTHDQPVGDPPGERCPRPSPTPSPAPSAFNALSGREGRSVVVNLGVVGER